MKFKYYLRGFGTGVLVATMLLVIAFRLNEHKPSAVNPSDKETSSHYIRRDDEETTQSAEGEETKEKDKTKEAGETTADNQKQETDSKDRTSEKDKDGTEKQNGEEAQTTETQSGADKKETDGQESKTSQQETTQAVTTAAPPETTTAHEQPSVEPSSVTPPSTVVITIQSGMESREAAELLQSVGLVDSAVDFDEYMQQSGHESRLRIGQYEIPKGASYEEIAEIITGNR